MRRSGEGNRLVLSVRALLSVVPLFLACSAAGGSSDSSPGIQLIDVELDKDLGALPFSNERTLTRSATYQYDLSKVVGRALFLSKVNGVCTAATSDAFDAILLSPESYLRADTKLDPVTVNKTLYDHKVSGRAAAALNVFAFAATLSDDKLAQVTVVDAASTAAPTNSLTANWKTKLLQDAGPTGCPAVLITGAKVRVATFRFYRKTAADASGGVESVFKAKGELFKEDSEAETDVAIAFDGSIVSGTPGNPQAIELKPDDKVLPLRIKVPSRGFLLLNQKNLQEIQRRLQNNR